MHAQLYWQQCIDPSRAAHEEEDAPSSNVAVTAEAVGIEQDPTQVISDQGKVYSLRIPSRLCVHLLSACWKCRMLFILLMPCACATILKWHRDIGDSTNLLL